MITVFTVFEQLSLVAGSSATFIVRWPGGGGYLESPGSTDISVLWIITDVFRDVNFESGGDPKVTPFPTNEFPIETGGSFWLPPCTIKLVVAAGEGGSVISAMRIYKK